MTNKDVNIVYAFTIESLLSDARLEKQGVLYNKLVTYNKPFLFFYNGVDFHPLDLSNQTTEYAYSCVHSDMNNYVLGLASVNIHNMTTVALTTLSKHIPDVLIKRYPRFYLTMTNFCNRSCPFCCCSSGPTRSTFLSFERFLELLSMENEYEVQFEGGEPLLHPDFWKMLDHCLSDEKCKLIVLCTNSVYIPFNNKDKLREWLTRFSKKPFLLKPSYNSYLVKHDKSLLSKLTLLKQVWSEIEWARGSNFIINARRDQTTPDKEIWITEDLKRSDLLSHSNVFFYQKMGLAQDDRYLEPVIVKNQIKFYLIAPDGTNWSTGLTERAKYMEDMA